MTKEEFYKLKPGDTVIANISERGYFTKGKYYTVRNDIVRRQIDEVEGVPIVQDDTEGGGHENGWGYGFFDAVVHDWDD